MFSPEEIDRFTGICSSFGVNVSKEMIEKFQAHASLLLEWNARIHLVSKGDARSDRILRHFVDSLLIFKAVDIPRSASLLDLGAGAGFPSIPIKIVRNDIRSTLVESTHKKALFLRKLIEALGLKDVRILNQRAEELSGDADLVGGFDLVTAKAMGELNSVVQLSEPLIKIGGMLVSYKGTDAKQEMAETKLPSQYRIKDAIRVEIAEVDLIRYLIVVQKVDQ
jgi:16S rRNA (guanine527-N7)-methyltransferase